MKQPDWEWHRRAQASIAQGALTNSKRPECLVFGVYPTHMKRGNGCFLWDTSGKRYVDYICGLGTNILGYGEEETSAAVAFQARQGASLSLGSEIEVVAAEKIKEIFPFVDLVRFLKSGSEACTAAVKIARAKTGRGLVLTEGYHGWHDLFVELSPPAMGVAATNQIQTFNSLEQVTNEVAAVIIEPVMTDLSGERIAWLRDLRERCTKTGTVLIFDEIITGFRFPKFSVANYLGIAPDLICLGKALANGMPLAVVGGKREIMNCGEYFVSSTYAGETLSLVAALKTMHLLQTKYRLDYLWEQGGRFITRFNAIWPEVIKIEGYPTRGRFVGDEIQKALFWQEACRAGILFGPSWFFNFQHIGESDQVLSTCQDIITRLKTGSVKLEGDLPANPFAAKLREKKS